MRHIYLRMYIVSTMMLAMWAGMPLCGRAQQADSLERAIKEHAFDDTTALNLRLQLAGIYAQGNPDKLISLANATIPLAQQLGNGDKVGICYQYLGFGFDLQNDQQRAITAYRNALEYYTRVGDKPRMVKVLTSIGSSYARGNDDKNTFTYYNRAIALGDSIGDNSDVGHVYQSMASVYANNGAYPDALESALRSLALFEKISDDDARMVMLMQIGQIYAALGDNKSALAYLGEGKQMLGKAHEVKQQMDYYLNAGMVYGEMNDNGHSLQAFQQALHLADSVHDEYYRNACLVDIAQTYYETGDYVHAFPLYQECLATSQKENDPDGISMAQNAIGDMLVKKGKTSEGITHLLAAMEIIKDGHEHEKIFTVAGNLSKAYSTLHDYKHALQYDKLYTTYRDSVFNDQSRQRVMQLQFDYQLQKKQNEIELLQKNSELKHNELERQKITMWALIIGLALLLIVIALLYNSRQHEKKIKEVHAVQREEIRRQATQLAELNTFKDKTFSVLSHDLRGPLNSFTATMMLLDEAYITPEDFAALQPEVNDQLATLNILLDNLLQWSRNRMKGGIKTYPEVLPLRQLVEENIETVASAAMKKDIRVNNLVPDGLRADADREQVNIVLRNVLSNAIKFTPGNGSVTVSAGAAGDHVRISVKDTGVGITPDQVSRLFTPAGANSLPGTDGEKGIGLGLLLCYDFVRANGGEINVESEPGRGTTFHISLPAHI